MEGVQKQLVNMVSGLKGKSYQDKLTELGLDSLEDRRVRIDLVQTYKILNGIDKVDRHTWFKTVAESNSRPTRQTEYPGNLVRQCVSRTDIRQNFFSQRVVTQWNSLPNYVKDSTSVNSFKNNYDQFRGNNSGADLPTI